MKLTTVAEMRKIDYRAIQEIGIPEIVLMENAAREIFQAMSNLLGEVAGKKICVVAGTGNNGGDAFAVARHLTNAGGRVMVFLLGSPEKMTASARTNYDVICHMGIQVFSLAEPRAWDKLLVVLKTSDGVLDGLLGTGFQGTLRPETAKLINIINAAELPVVAVDIPSGVNGDNGQVTDTAIRATVTVTLGLPKWGMMFAPGSLCCGSLLSDGIGIPASLLNSEEIQQEMLYQDIVKAMILPRPMNCHKGTCGRVLVIAGSRGMTGAATLAAKSALRVGAGVVTLGACASLCDIFANKLTEVMTTSLPDGGKGYMGMENLGQLLQLAEKYDVVLLGPGLGRHEDTMDLVREFVCQCTKPMVLDADAIYAFKEQGDLLQTANCPPVLTPHLGEMSVLLGITVEELKSNLLELSRKAAKNCQATMVVKSESTIIVCPDGRTFVTSTGNPGMATAGCGDVLAGTIAGLWEQTVDDTAALAGVYIHGCAGDLAANKLGNCLLAGDIIDHIPQAIKSIAEK